MSQELLKQIVELLLPVADVKNWGYTDYNGDFRHHKEIRSSFNTYKMDSPQIIAKKILDLIYAQDVEEQLRDALNRVSTLESQIETLIEDKNYRDNR